MNYLGGMPPANLKIVEVNSDFLSLRSDISVETTNTPFPPLLCNIWQKHEPKCAVEMCTVSERHLTQV